MTISGLTQNAQLAASGIVDNFEAQAGKLDPNSQDFQSLCQQTEQQLSDYGFKENNSSIFSGLKEFQEAATENHNNLTVDGAGLKVARQQDGIPTPSTEDTVSSSENGNPSPISPNLINTAKTFEGSINLPAGILFGTGDVKYTAMSKSEAATLLQSDDPQSARDILMSISAQEKKNEQGYVDQGTAADVHSISDLTDANILLHTSDGREINYAAPAKTGLDAQNIVNVMNNHASTNDLDAAIKQFLSD